MAAKTRVIGRILILYLGVLIPLLCSSLLIEKHAFERMERQEGQRMQAILTNISDELDAWFKEFRGQGNGMGEIWELSPAYVLEDPARARQAISQIGYMDMSNPRTEDVAVYYGVGKLYTSRGIVNVRTYFRNTMDCTESGAERGAAAMSAASPSVFFLDTDGKSGLLMYHIPIRKYAPGFQFSVNFLVPVERVRELLETYALDCPSLFCLSVGEEKVWFQITDGNEVIVGNKAPEAWHDSDREAALSRAAGEMEMTLYFDPRISRKQLQEFQVGNILLLALGILLSTLLSFAFSYRRWNRFQSLVGNVRPVPYTGPDKGKFMDEFDYIRLVMEQSRQESEQMGQDAQMYRHAMRRQVAAAIFHGLATKSEDICQLLKACGLERCEEYYYICGVLMKEKAEIRRLEPLFDGLLYCDGEIGGRRLVLFLGEAPNLDPDCKERMAAADILRGKLEAAGIPAGCFAFSQMYDSLSLANYAYLEAMALLKAMPQGQGEAECWDRYLSSPSDWLDERQSGLLEGFLDALGQRDLERARENLDKLLAGTADAEGQRYLRYCIRQSMLLAIRDVEFEPDTQLMHRIQALNPVDGESFYEKALKILQILCGADRRLEKLEEAVRYVQENYCRYDLSLEEVAAQAGLSKTQMSKLFKAQMDVNYLDYLTQLRMEKAKKLLSGTEKPIKEIIADVGYIDRASFAKKFKAYYGVSPAQYRSRERG